EANEAGSLAAALGERPIRLSLEVEQDEARLRAERLAEVIVAVDADLHAALGTERLEVGRPRAQDGLAGEQRAGVGLELARQVGEPRADVRARAAEVAGDPGNRGGGAGGGRRAR